MSEFYICDLRPEWRGEWAVTFWRPTNAGYAYPLSWSGRYDRETVMGKHAYYTKRHGRSLIRFAVPCEIADRLSSPTPAGMIDGDAGPVVLNTPENRRNLRAAALKIEAPRAPEETR